MNDLTPADHNGIRLAWRRQTPREVAATLAIILVAPRSALLVLNRLDARIPPLPAAGADHLGAAVSRRRISR